MRFVLLVALIVLGFLVAAATTYPLWRDKMYRELAAFAVIWALALYLSVSQIMNLNPPRPSSFLEAVFKPLTSILDRYIL